MVDPVFVLEGFYESFADLGDDLVFEVMFLVLVFGDVVVGLNVAVCCCFLEGLFKVVHLLFL